MNRSSFSSSKYCVPWWDRDEWMQIQSELFGDSNKLKSHALRRIMAWRSRTGFKLPKVIDCTAQLVRAIIDDKELAGLDGGSDSLTGVQDKQAVTMSYAMAIVRFINLLTESFQNKQFALPIHLLAKELGLPVWLVDLRHDATHSHMPSLPLLRSGAEIAIQWLKKEYWDKSCAPNTGDKMETEKHGHQLVQDMLVYYQQEQFMLRQAQDNVGGKQKKKDKTAITTLLTDLQKLKNDDRKTLIQCLVQPGYMVSTEEQLQALTIPTSDISENQFLPKKLVDFWWPIIKNLQHMNSLSDLVQQLSDQLNDESSLQNKIVGGWLKCLARASSPRNSSNEANPTKTLKNADLLPWRYAMTKCAMEPCETTFSVLNCILQNHPDALTSDEKTKVTSLMSVYLGKEKLPSATEASDFYTVKALNKSSSASDPAPVENIAVPEKERQSPPIVPWSVYSGDLLWENIPIGAILGTKGATSSTLELTDLIPKETPTDRDGDGDSAMELCDNWEQSQLVSRQDNTSQWTNREVQQIMENVGLF